MHALDAPMAADAVGDAVDVEGGRTDIGASVEERAVGQLGSTIELDDGGNVGEARLPGIAALGGNPIDDRGGPVGPCLDAAVTLLDGGLGDELGGRRGAEIVQDVGLEG